MDHKSIEEFILGLPNAKRDYPFGEAVAVYKIPVGDGPNPEQKMFALIPEDKSPVNISLKCDPLLSVTLREKYESVMPGYHLNKKHWNTVVLTGQLSVEEVKDLILLSYNLVLGGK